MGQDSAYITHPKKLQPKTSKGLHHWISKGALPSALPLPELSAASGLCQSCRPAAQGTYMQSFSVSLELSVQ